MRRERGESVLSLDDIVAGGKMVVEWTYVVVFVSPCLEYWKLDTDSFLQILQVSQ